MGISIVPEMVIEKNPPCRYVPIADEQAAPATGTVVLRGRSLTRANHAFLSHLSAPPPVSPSVLEVEALLAATFLKNLIRTSCDNRLDDLLVSILTALDADYPIFRSFRAALSIRVLLEILICVITSRKDAGAEEGRRRVRRI